MKILLLVLLAFCLSFQSVQSGIFSLACFCQRDVSNKHSLFIVRSLNVFILKNPTLKLFSKCICLSFCWSGHVSSPLWSNVSKVKSLKDHSLKLFSKCNCLCLCLCICFKITFWHVWWLAGSDYRKISKSWINPICRCSHYKKSLSYSHQLYQLYLFSQVGLAIVIDAKLGNIIANGMGVAAYPFLAKGSRGVQVLNFQKQFHNFSRIGILGCSHQ